MVVYLLLWLVLCNINNNIIVTLLTAYLLRTYAQIVNAVHVQTIITM